MSFNATLEQVRKNDFTLSQIEFHGLRNGIVKRLSEEEGKALAAALEKNTHVHSVTLYDCGITVSVGVAFARMLKTNAALHTLNLSGNRLPLTVGRAFVGVLKQTHTLTDLDLSLSLVFEEAQDEDHQALSDMLQTNRGLTSINLQSTGLDCKGFTAIAKGLKKNHSLKRLILSMNKDIEGCIALAIALKVNRSLEHLDLTLCEFGEKAAKAMCHALMTNRSLQTLVIDRDIIPGLSTHNASFETVEAIEGHLKHNRSAAGKAELAQLIKDDAEIKSLSTCARWRRSCHNLAKEIGWRPPFVLAISVIALRIIAISYRA